MTTATDRDDAEIPIGSRWLETTTNRTIVIVQRGPNSPWWRYEDDPKQEWRHCDILDFFLWGRFRRLT